jgi:hypothetical protein
VLSTITTGSTVTGMGSDYAACSGDTSTVPTTGFFQLVNSNHMLSRTKFSDLTDGTTHTLMIGEKHIQLGTFGNAVTDGVIYSGSENQTYHRRAGASWPRSARRLRSISSSGAITRESVSSSSRTAASRVEELDPGPTLALLAHRFDGMVIPDF